MKMNPFVNKKWIFATDFSNKKNTYFSVINIYENKRFDCILISKDGNNTEWALIESGRNKVLDIENTGTKSKKEVRLLKCVYTDYIDYEVMTMINFDDSENKEIHKKITEQIYPKTL